jgi:hypothetical protein
MSSSKKVLVVGHSHVHALKMGWSTLSSESADDVSFFNIKELAQPIPDQGVPHGSWPSGGGKYINPEDVTKNFSAMAADAPALIFLVQGNEHHALGLVDTAIDISTVSAELRNRAARTVGVWLDLLWPNVTEHDHAIMILPPPPLESDDKILLRPGTFREAFIEHGIRKSSERLQLWHIQCEVMESEAQKRGIRLVPLPESIFSQSGFLAPEFSGNDPIHGNQVYGHLVLKHALAALHNPGIRLDTMPASHKAMEHPYRELPDSSYWKQSISLCAQQDVDPVINPPFLIAPADAVATAGSCFAQHISRRLRAANFNFLRVEGTGGNGSDMNAKAHYDFSARYGNVYTARQLLQLFNRAFGFYKPLEQAWKRADGKSYCDPFRPRIEPDGFSTVDALLQDRDEHLQAVQDMFRNLDVFVFTLGLTECWLSKLDGAAFPIAPGVAGGEFNTNDYIFHNFKVNEIVADLNEFLEKLRLVNPSSRVILTVSPVPLVATYEPRHVLVSTIYSKSVLRVAAEEIVSSHEGVYYFPSYEIIVGPHALGGYFGEDRRGVTEAGVDHVMSVFMRRMTKSLAAENPMINRVNDDKLIALQQLADAACDEELLAK